MPGTHSPLATDGYYGSPGICFKMWNATLTAIQPGDAVYLAGIPGGYSDISKMWCAVGKSANYTNVKSLDPAWSVCGISLSTIAHLSSGIVAWTGALRNVHARVTPTSWEQGMVLSSVTAGMLAPRALAAGTAHGRIVAYVPYFTSVAVSTYTQAVLSIS